MVANKGEYTALQSDKKPNQEELMQHPEKSPLEESNIEIVGADIQESTSNSRLADETKKEEEDIKKIVEQIIEQEKDHCNLKGKNIGIIGGGIAGCTTALVLANQGAKVTLFEKEPKILSESSDATPCRLGAGFHYQDLPTAIAALEAGVHLIQYLKKETGSSFQVHTSVQGGQILQVEKIYYAISNESLVKPEEVLANFEALKQHYKTMVESNPENEVMGPPDAFYKVVNKQNFAGILDLSKINMVIETCETLFDWPLFKPYLVGQLNSSSDITIKTHTEVTKIQREPANLQTQILTKTKSYNFHHVVNAAWNNVDRLNQTAGYLSGRETINRWKCMAIVKLPQNLVGRCFLVGYGAFCSLSSRPDGIGYLTYEPKTNLQQFDSNKINNEENNYKKHILTGAQKESLGKSIIAGATEYIPALQTCEWVDLKVGTVRTDEGKINIYAKDKHFGRSFKGVYAAFLGLIVNEARKHTYWYDNAVACLRLMQIQMIMPIKIHQLVQTLSEKVESLKPVESAEGGKAAEQMKASSTLSRGLVYYFSTMFIDTKDLVQLHNSLAPEKLKKPNSFSMFCENKSAMHSELKEAYAKKFALKSG